MKSFILQQFFLVLAFFLNSYLWIITDGFLNVYSVIQLIFAYLVFGGLDK